jgi:tRNA pseudouridine32 synthase/23S rRNA pseudouridine746 synthase
MSTDLELRIVHRDSLFWVVEKPSGMLSVPGRGPEKRDSVTTRVRSMVPGCIDHPEVHRLDMDTSGLLVVALSKESQRHLSQQFQRRTTRKRYVALLEGVLSGERGTIQLPFRLDIENRPTQILDEVHGKPGITDWERIGLEGEQTRVGFVPITGRTHQLRVHAAHPRGLGIPIVGDTLYGAGDRPGELKLHATELGFRNPGTGEPMQFHSTPAF